MIDRDQLVYAEQIRIVYSQTWSAIVGSSIGGGLFFWNFWTVVDSRVLFGWAACLILLLVGRASIYLAFLRRQVVAEQVRPWGRIYIIAVFLQGSIWGAPALIFIPVPDPIYNVIVAMWMIGFSAASISAYSVYMKVLLAFFIPTMLPGSIHLISLGGQLNIAVGIALCVYSVIVIRAVLPINRSMINAIKLNFKLEEEIEERKKVESKLREMSLTDGLTQLPNRRRFDEVFEREFRRAQRVSYPLSLIMLDIDYFKAFNDTYGHPEGDTCLQRISRSIEAVINRPGDLAARYGGEEFAVILPDTDAENACQIAEEICKGVRALEISHRGSNIVEPNVVTISAGVASIVPPRKSLRADLIHDADSALYQAKDRGRNQVVVC